ncbi:hypothetical protein VKT23_006364 [Stygiomarasmius scandens]|uniref:Uncharacterized protein n=1 Tax=Marasmiellus scandens TaxID=2682957 RepID=A0ABR1JMJ8_9AGAR
MPALASVSITFWRAQFRLFVIHDLRHESGRSKRGKDTSHLQNSNRAETQTGIGRSIWIRKSVLRPCGRNRIADSTSKSVHFVNGEHDADVDNDNDFDNDFDDDYQPDEGPVDKDDGEHPKELSETEEGTAIVQKSVKDRYSHSKSTKSTFKHQTGKGKSKRSDNAKSPSKTATKPAKKTWKRKTIPLYEDDDNDTLEDDRCDPEDDPDAPQFEPNAEKYTHTPGPLSKECLAEVNQLVYEFDAKMNAIGRKYHKSVPSLWDAAHMSKAGGVRELSTWNAFLAYKTKQEGAKANPGENNPDFVVRLSHEYQALMQEELGNDWKDPDQRREVAKERGWLDFVQEGRLEITRDERENGVKKSTMQRCINEILKLGRLYYEFYGLILSRALYDLNNHNRSQLFGYGAPYERVMTSEQVAFTKELKSMSAKLRVVKDQEEQGLEGKAAIQHLVAEYCANPRNTDHLRKLYGHIFNQDINEATEGERSKIKYSDFYRFARDKNIHLTHWPAGLLVDKLQAGEFPNARDLTSDKLKDILSKRIQYWEALLKRADLRVEEEERIVSEQDMGPRVVAWSKEEVDTPWNGQYTFPLIIDDKGNVLFTVHDVSRVMALKIGRESDNESQNDENRNGDIVGGTKVDERVVKFGSLKGKGKGKEKVKDDQTWDSDDDDEDDDEDDNNDEDMPPLPLPHQPSRYLADVRARHNFSDSPSLSPPPNRPATSHVKGYKNTHSSSPLTQHVPAASRIKVVKSSKPLVPVPGPSKPSVTANSRTRALLEVARGAKSQPRASGSGQKRKDDGVEDDRQVKKRKM